MAHANPGVGEIDAQAVCDVSIIIPIGPGDESWHQLIHELRLLPFTAEILCVGTTEPPEPSAENMRNESDALETNGAMRRKWIVSPRGRARQMNLGAERATGRFLWFLHADSRINRTGLDALHRSFDATPDRLLYFNLAFLEDGPRWMRLNAWGTWARSHWLGMPFGDQGFCLERDTFRKLGGFPEAAPYGEDHLLVWMARRRGVRLQCTGATLHTSARKYRKRGWIRTTCHHIWLTAWQAWPQFWLWLWGV